MDFFSPQSLLRLTCLDSYSCTLLKREKKKYSKMTADSVCLQTTVSVLTPPLHVWIFQRKWMHVWNFTHTISYFYCQMQRVGLSEILQNGKCSEVMVEVTDIKEEPHYSCHFQWISYSTNTKKWQPEATWHSIHLSALMHASGWGGRTVFFLKIQQQI